MYIIVYIYFITKVDNSEKYHKIYFLRQFEKFEKIHTILFMFKHPGQMRPSMETIFLKFGIRRKGRKGFFWEIIDFFF